MALRSFGLPTDHQPLRARAGDRLPRSICWRRVRLSQEKASRERSPRLCPAARCLTCSPARRGYRQRPRESDQEGKFKGSTRLSSRRGDARNSSVTDVRGGTGIHTCTSRSQKHRCTVLQMQLFDTVQKSEESQHVSMSNQLHGLSQNQRTQKAKICAPNKRDQCQEAKDQTLLNPPHRAL